jgi:hypothetical protein
MKRTIGLRPSWGFVFLVSSHLLLISMLAWGYTEPELDKVWLTIQRMQRDNFNGLSALDAQTIRTSLHDYPGLPRVFIGQEHFGFVEPTQEGWVKLPESHLISDGTIHGTAALAIECRAPDSAFPVTVSFDYEGHHQSLRFLENGLQRLELQLDSTPRPAWVQVSIKPEHAASPKPLPPEVRIKTSSESVQTVVP